MDFLTVDAFLAAVRPHFDPLAYEFGFEGPEVDNSDGTIVQISYRNSVCALLLSWDVRERLFDCHIARASATNDDRDWLSVNEVLAVRNASDRWVTADDVRDVGATAFAQAMVREVANLREYCADVLGGDWSVKPAVERWHQSFQ